MVVPGEQNSNAHRILDGGRNERAHVGAYDGDFQRTEYDLTDGQSTLAHVSIGTTSTAITGITVTDGTGHQIATIEQKHERISFLKGRASFVLTRQEGLADPLRMLTVITPLLVHLDFEVRELRSNTGRVQRDWRPL